MLHTQTLAPQTLELIQALQAEPMLKGFHLVGGTSLALQIGHRISVDIDLFTREDYDVDDLLSLFINRYGFQRNYQRGKTLKDFIDVYFLLEQFTLEEMLSFYKTKYQQDDALIILRSLVFFDNVDLAEWPLLISEPQLTFEQVKNRIIDVVKPML